MTGDRVKIYYAEIPPALDAQLTEEDAAIIGRQIARVVKWWGTVGPRRFYDEAAKRNLAFVLANASFDYCRYPREPQLRDGDQ